MTAPIAFTVQILMTMILNTRSVSSLEGFGTIPAGGRGDVLGEEEKGGELTFFSRHNRQPS